MKQEDEIRFTIEEAKSIPPRSVQGKWQLVREAFQKLILTQNLVVAVPHGQDPQKVKSQLFTALSRRFAGQFVLALEMLGKGESERWKLRVWKLPEGSRRKPQTKNKEGGHERKTGTRNVSGSDDSSSAPRADEM